ncbi:MAG: hypothetical protein QOA19_10125 [Nitrososphaeraceae archaeon]|nr:hypothetical protein [Nitrososphaeraceae archaeon]MDW0196021.1 hypothetical protein [Nitrososphaeraceae archaeon]MDW0197461.1 hypothetical protein [Nitrososphaeraceae archaeon]MDW0203325.1 hypothetical protein [Nitrososphaeraceae archaeon]MDW0205318.1 hypothetical protein [Nitrososphaeraceae archaeon]
MDLLKTGSLSNAGERIIVNGKLLRLIFKVLSLKDTPRLPNSNGQ